TFQLRNLIMEFLFVAQKECPADSPGSVECPVRILEPRSFDAKTAKIVLRIPHGTANAIKRTWGNNANSRKPPLLLDLLPIFFDGPSIADIQNSFDFDLCINVRFIIRFTEGFIHGAGVSGE